MEIKPNNVKEVAKTTDLPTILKILFLIFEVNCFSISMVDILSHTQLPIVFRGIGE